MPKSDGYSNTTGVEAAKTTTTVANAFVVCVRLLRMPTEIVTLFFLNAGKSYAFPLYSQLPLWT